MLRTTGLTATIILMTGTAPAMADLLGDHFVHGGGCYERIYDKAHLRAHPDQVVTEIHLEATPDEAVAGSTLLYLQFTTRPGSRYGADASCSSANQCLLEGDGGSFSLAEQGAAIKLTVGDFLALEGNEDFSPDLATSDDRVFLLNPC